jgi:ketosteroid isomerase-like protein
MANSAPRKSAAAALVLALAVASAAAAADLKSLVRAELAFSRLSEAQGIRAAFVANLAEEAIVFRPRPVPGLKLYRDRASVPGHLSWGPAYAYVSTSGDLGYTTGPYELRKEKASDPVAGRGHFVSVWRRQKDGAWKVVFDGGISYDKPFTAEPVLDPERLAGGADSGGAAGAPHVEANAKREIERAEAALAEATLAGKPALVDTMTSDARLYFDGEHPLVGKAAAADALAMRGGGVTGRAQAVHASSAGDLGYVYGLAESVAAPGPAQEFSFLRIWKKSASGRWEIALCLFSPIK